MKLGIRQLHPGDYPVAVFNLTACRECGEQIWLLGSIPPDGGRCLEHDPETFEARTLADDVFMRRTLRPNPAYHK